MVFPGNMHCEVIGTTSPMYESCLGVVSTIASLLIPLKDQDVEEGSTLCLKYVSGLVV